MIDLEIRGPQAPQGNIPTAEAKLGWINARPARQTLWLIPAHGGAGITTLSQLDDCFAEADRCWPQGSNAACVVVARTSASGLQAAQAILTQWADGGAGGAHLLGLILIDDAPRRLPKPLADLARIIGGGAPRTWRIAWNPAWRCGEPVIPDGPTTPPAVKRMAAELRGLLADDINHTADANQTSA